MTEERKQAILLAATLLCAPRIHWNSLLNRFNIVPSGSLEVCK